MKLIFYIFILTSIIYSQADIVNSNHYVYTFLERMEIEHKISDYNSFEIPKSRGEIASFLIQLNDKVLTSTDKKILNDLTSEFYFEINGTTDNSQMMLKGDYSFLSDKEKYFYFYEDKEIGNVFVNFLAEAQTIGYYDNNKLLNSQNLSLGGSVRGTVAGKFGFLLEGTNGQIFGDKIAAFRRNELNYNFKLNEKPEETFYDNTQGYITADFNNIKFQLGRTRVLKGHGFKKFLMDTNSPLFDYFGMQMKIGIINYSFLHGKLLGPKSFLNDSITGGENLIENKFLVYHRIGFDFSKHFKIGFGEVVVYGNRSIDLSFLNPFNFYKSIEHSNQDRDNSMMFIDISNNSIKGLKFFGMLLFDDMSYSKIGSGWWGNQTAWNFGVITGSITETLPLDFRIEYTRLEPYLFTHRLLRNNYSNFGYPVGIEIQPNSDLIFIQTNYRFSNRIWASIDFSFSRNGANPILSDETIINVGGDRNLGHRIFDSENVNFLDGELQTFRRISLSLTVEPFNNFYLNGKTIYLNNSLQNSVYVKEIETYLTLSFKF